VICLVASNDGAVRGAHDILGPSEWKATLLRASLGVQIIDGVDPPLFVLERQGTAKAGA
jgi:hypothetical protein